MRYVVVAAAMLVLPAVSQETAGDTFYHAIRANDLPRLHAIIASGADVNARDERGVTPLMYAAWVGSVGAMTQLLDRGADPSLANTFARRR